MDGQGPNHATHPVAAQSDAKIASIPMILIATVIFSGAAYGRSFIPLPIPSFLPRLNLLALISNNRLWSSAR